MNNINAKGLIEELSLAKGVKGEYWKLKISGKNYKVFDNADAFSQLSEGKATVGDNIDFDYSEHPGDYQGQPIVYKNIEKINLSGTVKVQSLGTEKTISKPYVDTNVIRQDQIRRESCINAATEFFKLNKEIMASQDKKAMEGFGISEITVLNLAEKYDYVVQSGDFKLVNYKKAGE